MKNEDRKALIARLMDETLPALRKLVRSCAPKLPDGWRAPRIRTAEYVTDGLPFGLFVLEVCDPTETFVTVWDWKTFPVGILGQQYLAGMRTAAPWSIPNAVCEALWPVLDYFDHGLERAATERAALAIR